MRELKEFWKKSQNDLIFTQATALAYTTLVSLVPLLAVAFFLFKAFGGFEKLIPQLQPIIESNLAPAFSDKISSYLDTMMLNVNSGTVGVVGLLGFLVTAIATISTIEKTFNIIWGVKTPRPLKSRVTMYWTLLTIGPLLLAVSTMFGVQASAWLKNDHGFIANILLYVLNLVPYLASGILFSVLFLIIPNTVVNIKDALKAGIATGIVFEIGKLVYAEYAKRTISHDAVYGAVVVIPLFLLWLYVVWLITLFGAELCCYFQFKRLRIKYRFNWEERLSPFAIADILELLSKANHERPPGLKEEEILSHLQMPYHELASHLHFLEEKEWIVRSKGRYHLVVSEFDMDEISKSLDDHRYIPKGTIASAVYRKSKSLWQA